MEKFNNCSSESLTCTWGKHKENEKVSFLHPPTFHPTESFQRSKMETATRKVIRVSQREIKRIQSKKFFFIASNFRRFIVCQVFWWQKDAWQFYGMNWTTMGGNGAHHPSHAIQNYIINPAVDGFIILRLIWNWWKHSVAALRADDARKYFSY